jgi:hypothetical protein
VISNSSLLPGWMFSYQTVQMMQAFHVGRESTSKIFLTRPNLLWAQSALFSILWPYDYASVFTSQYADRCMA